MDIAVFAIGRMKKGAEADLAELYAERCRKSFPAVGLRFTALRDHAESRAAAAERRQEEEAAMALSALKEGSLLVLADERGQNISSAAFAQKLGQWRDSGRRSVVFALGGADGFAESLRQRADMLLAFGAMTWPHRLARIMLAEQLYRAGLILANHPYHRE